MNLTNYIDYQLVMDLGLYLMFAIALIALWYDLTYKPKVYDLVMLLDRRISNSAPKTEKKLCVTFTPIVAVKDYSLQAEAKNVKELYSKSEYRTPKGFQKETYTGGWVKAEFIQPKKSAKVPYTTNNRWTNISIKFIQPKKSAKVPYRLPVQRLTLEESRKLELGSVELEKVYDKNHNT